MVAVLTPYRFCDTTLAALSSAEAISALGYHCNVFSVGPVASGLHPYWDNRVLPLSAFRPSEHVVHFAPNLLGPTCHHPYARHVLASCERPPFPCPYANTRYAVVAAPSCQHLQAIETGVDSETRWAVPWADAAAPRVREGRRGHGEIRLLVFVPSAKPARRAVRIVEMLTRLLASTEASIRLFSAAPWCGRAGNRLRAACQQSDQRLEFVRSRSLVDYWAALEWCDWFTDLSLDSGFGSFTAGAMARGAMTVSYAIPPFNEWFTDAGVRGSLYSVLPCRDGSDLTAVGRLWESRLADVVPLLDAQLAVRQGSFSVSPLCVFREFWKTALSEEDASLH